MYVTTFWLEKGTHVHDPMCTENHVHVCTNGTGVPWYHNGTMVHVYVYVYVQIISKTTWNTSTRYVDVYVRTYVRTYACTGGVQYHGSELSGNP